MKTVLFYYDEFSNFEVACSAFQFHGSLVTAALEKRPYKSEENMIMVPHCAIGELDPGEVGLVIIPGGDPQHLYGNGEIRTFLGKVADHGGVLAGICGGTFLMAQFGFLKGRRCTGSGSGIPDDWREKYPFFEGAIIDNSLPVVADGKMVTAKGQGFVELSLKLNEVMGMYKDDEERLADRKWWLGEE